MDHLRKHKLDHPMQYPWTSPLRPICTRSKIWNLYKTIIKQLAIWPNPERSTIGKQLIQYWSLLNWRIFRFRCGCVAVLVNWCFVIILSRFAVFKNVDAVGVSSGSKLCATFLNIAKHFKRFVAVAVIFSIYLNSVLYPNEKSSSLTPHWIQVWHLDNTFVSICGTKSCWTIYGLKRKKINYCTFQKLAFKQMSAVLDFY